MRASELIERFENSPYVDYCEPDDRYPGLVLIVGAGGTVPFSLMDEVNRNPTLSVWNAVCVDGKPGVIIGCEKDIPHR